MEGVCSNCLYLLRACIALPYTRQRIGEFIYFGEEDFLRVWVVVKLCLCAFDVNEFPSHYQINLRSIID
jgi:hypothetical protein